MHPAQRLAVARLAYAQALGVARAQTRPAAWRRLVRAASNLRAAARECAARSTSSAVPAPGVRGPPGDAALLAFPERRPPPRAWSPEVLLDLELARALMAEARELRAEARRLRASLAALRTAPRGPSIPPV
jgi:hypothetical protein